MSETIDTFDDWWQKREEEFSSAIIGRRRQLWQRILNAKQVNYSILDEPIININMARCILRMNGMLFENDLPKIENRNVSEGESTQGSQAKGPEAHLKLVEKT